MCIAYCSYYEAVSAADVKMMMMMIISHLVIKNMTALLDSTTSGGMSVVHKGCVKIMLYLSTPIYMCIQRISMMYANLIVKKSAIPAKQSTLQ